MSRLAFVLALLVAPAAFADWEVTRSDADPRLVAQLKARLRGNAHDAYALKKLIDLYRRHQTLDALARELEGNEAALGELERARGNFERAARHFEAAPRTADDDVALGECLARLRKDEGAKVALERALGEADAALQPAILRKLAELDLGADARIGYLERLVAAVPADDDARSRLAELDASRSRFAEATRELDVLIEHAARDPERRARRLLERGAVHDAAQRPNDALADYHRAWELLPPTHHLRREALERTASIHRKKDELRALAAEWERAWPVRNRGFVEWDVLARVYEETGDSTHAQECFQKALAIDPHALETRRRLITIFEREGRDVEVIAELRRLVAVAPGEPRFRLELAERLRRDPSGEKEALETCARVARETRDPSVHALLAELYTRWGLTQLALAERERLIRLEPDDETHLINLGELYFERGDKKRAEQVWRRLLERGKREQSLARLAEVYAEHNLNRESLELYQQAARLAPKDPAIQRGLASALERTHRDVEAAAIWHELYDLALAQKKRAEAYELRQRLLTVLPRLGQLGRVLHESRRRVDGAQDDWTLAGYALLAADAALRLGRADEAEQILKLMTRRVSDRELAADGFIGLAQVARARHQIEQQIAALKRAAELAPGRARELYAQVAQLSLELYRDADALAYANKAISLGPPDATAQLRLAEVLERREQLDEAISAYRRALEIDERMWRVRFQLARLHLRRGDNTEAARLYREVVRRAPDEDVVVEAARRATDLDEYLGTLGDLERELEPLAYAHADKRVYRTLLLDVYRRHAASLAAAGTPEAARELLRIGERALAPLLEVLAFGEAGERRQAVTLLAQLGNPQAAGPLLKLAEPGPEARRPPEVKTPFDARTRLALGLATPHAHDGSAIELRMAAALAGAELATVKEVPALLKLAKADGSGGAQEKQLRVAALYGLLRVGRPAGDQELVRALDAQVGEVQALACLALSTGAPARAQAAMLRVARESRFEVARTGCVMALGRLGAHAGEKALPPGTRATLEAILAGGGGEPERRAAWALGALGARASAGALIEAVFTKPEAVRRAAEAALARAPDETADWRFGPPVRHGDGFDVTAWLGAAHEPSPPRGAPAWRDLSAEVARAIGQALSRHQDLIARTLADLDGAPDVLSFGPLGPAPDEAAAVKLGEALLPALERCALNADPALRIRTASVLAKIAGGRKTLESLARDPKEQVRVAAVAALVSARRAGEDEVAQALAHAGWRERRGVALAIAEANGTTQALHTARVDDALVHLLDDPSGFVREAAALALAGAPRAPRIADALKRHRSDESPEVERAITAALARQSRPD